MNAPIKARKSPRNQPLKFDETLASALPARPVPVARPGLTLARPGLTLPQIRLALGIVWVAAALLGGVGLGRLIRESSLMAVTGEAPAPDATAPVSVVSAAAFPAGTIVRSAAPETASLTVQPALAATQAAAGNVFATVSTGLFQPGATSDALQPGFNHFGHSQGNIGTAAVR